MTPDTYRIKAGSDDIAVQQMVAHLKISASQHRYAQIIGFISNPDPRQRAIFNAAMEQCLFNPHFRLYLVSVDLSGTDLSGILLRRCNLSQANLSGAKLHGADLVNAFLLECNLTDADMTHTRMRCAVLTRADLTRARLDGADMHFVDLTGANLDRATIGDAGFAIAGTEIIWRTPSQSANYPGRTNTTALQAKMAAE